MRACKHCDLIKSIELMVKDAYLCKECKNFRRRTGKPVGRKPGFVPWNKGLGDAKHGWRYKKWANDVKERDTYVCQKCGSNIKEEIHAHHIVPWADSVALRFDISNGISLCRKCHTTEERKIKPEFWKQKRKPRSEETKAKLRLANLGKVPANKGKKGPPAWNKGIPQTDEVKMKLSVAMSRKGWRICNETGKRIWFEKIVT